MCVCVCTYIKCIVIHNTHLWVPLQENDNMTNRHKIFTFITTIIFYLYNTINIIHEYECTLNCTDFLMNSFSYNLYLTNLVWFFSCLLFFPCLPNYPTAPLYLYSFVRYCKIGEKPKEVMILRVIC